MVHRLEHAREWRVASVPRLRDAHERQRPSALWKKLSRGLDVRTALSRPTHAREKLLRSAVACLAVRPSLRSCKASKGE